MKKSLNIIFSTLVATFIFAVTSLITIKAEPRSNIQVVFGVLALVSAIMVLAGLAAFTELWQRKPKTFDYLAGNGGNSFCYTVLVDKVQYNINYDKLYKHLKADQGQVYVCNRDKWLKYDYSRLEIQCIKFALHDAGLATADGRGALKLLVTPEQVIDQLRLL